MSDRIEARRPPYNALRLPDLPQTREALRRLDDDRNSRVGITEGTAYRRLHDGLAKDLGKYVLNQPERTVATQVIAKIGKDAIAFSQADFLEVQRLALTHLPGKKLVLKAKPAQASRPAPGDTLREWVQAKKQSALSSLQALIKDVKDVTSEYAFEVGSYSAIRRGLAKAFPDLSDDVRNKLADEAMDGRPIRDLPGLMQAKRRLEALAQRTAVVATINRAFPDLARTPGLIAAVLNFLPVVYGEEQRGDLQPEALTPEQLARLQQLLPEEPGGDGEYDYNSAASPLNDKVSGAVREEIKGRIVAAAITNTFRKYEWYRASARSDKQALLVAAGIEVECNLQQSKDKRTPQKFPDKKLPGLIERLGSEPAYDAIQASFLAKIRSKVRPS